ncbi:UDP-N-acetylglucosamine transferase subunit ALG13 homolog [Zeugodacus cucurbitae]|uniref:UDP-N-acetylglucosamine transferase subunit ALG13 homolog n=1 Tax=Zeugodacus cucurbitae TaxID=28588 RepID=UPI0023D90E85|nr:UDP-N-acetylglucosamine transferase subunit ALG13 homolog [Zeugodacus cucurbitae]
MQWKVIYVTVGTTRFDELIREVVSARALDVLVRRGCQKLVIQYGHGRPVQNSENILRDYGITVEQYDFKLEMPRTDILNAGLVIGHAGAGTCMDILNHGRAGIIVINDRLMDNHQIELAQQLSDEGYLYYSNIEGLVETIKQANLEELKPYEKRNNMESFVKYLNEMIGT